ncbi:hypothetical protein Acear_0070 [Acetohalobium arabaticum DSM 5501]|uniref:Uncharacterized protein n=2 Tax=Acetohalobium TaxID=28186 RepID=D9QST3_ACEAZ|nr:hypothetical protein Acear_0070 [Acetohalobium arabaticum DSM 5501]
MTADNVLEYFRAEDDSEASTEEEVEITVFSAEDNSDDSLGDFNLAAEEIGEQVEDDETEIEAEEVEEQVENSSQQDKNKKGGENMEEQEVNLQHGSDDFAAEVPFCCVQVVPGNLEVIEDRLEAEDLKMTFTPKLECCIKEEMLECTANGANCQIDGKVVRLVGCIEYAISTINDIPDPIRGEFSTEAPQQNSADVSCKSTVCVNEIICCCERDESTLIDTDLCDDLDSLLDNIEVKFKAAKVKDCPKWADEPDKKIIKFTGKFKLPKLNNLPASNS